MQRTRKKPPVTPATRRLSDARRIPLGLGASFAFRRRRGSAQGVEWARRMFERVNSKKGIEAVTLGSALDLGGDPVTWLNASLPDKSPIPCCDRAPKPWRVAVTWTPEGMMTISGYGESTTQPIEETKVQINLGRPAR